MIGFRRSGSAVSAQISSSGLGFGVAGLWVIRFWGDPIKSGAVRKIGVKPSEKQDWQRRDFTLFLLPQVARRRG